METRNEKPRLFGLNGHSIPPGTRQLVPIQASTGISNQPLNITADILHGEKPGPCLLITACIHGDEINGTEIIRRLLNSPLLKHLSGTLLTIPIVNLPAFTSRSRYLPDRRDLNRTFPGSEKGSQGARLAYALTTEILPLCDAIIDLHTGAINRPNLPQIRIAAGDLPSLELGKSFSAPLTILSPLRPGTFREAAFTLDKPFALYESGEASKLDSTSIRFGLQGIISTMRHMGMLPPATPTQPTRKEIISENSVWERAPSGGLFIPHVALGKAVLIGEILGIIAPPQGGSENTEIISSTEGIVIGRNNESLANEGDALFHIANLHNAHAAEKQIKESNNFLPPLHPEEDHYPISHNPFSD